MTLPSRLDVPDVTELTSSPVYYTQNDPNLPEGENSFITRDELTSSGISLILNATNVGQVLQGNMNLPRQFTEKKAMNRIHRR